MNMAIRGSGKAQSGLEQLEDELLQNGGMKVHSHQEILPNFVLFEPFRSNAFAVFVIQEGEFSFKCNFVSYTLKTQDVFFVLPDSMIEITQISEDIAFLGMGFNRNYPKKQGFTFNSEETIHFLSENNTRKFALSDQEFTDMIFLLSSLNRKMQLPLSTKRLKEMVRHSFVSVMYELFMVQEKYCTINLVKLNRKERLTSDFLIMLSESFRSEKRIQYYADRLYITPRHLSQVVKQVTGKTAGEFIDEMVINEAKALLSAHVLSISQIADELQFSNQSFFGKYFKKYAGVSPTAYREVSFIGQNPPV